MTTAELREATKEFDKEFVGDTFGPPTAEQRARFERTVASVAGRRWTWARKRFP